MGDITYVRLKGHFIYVCLLMDVLTRIIRGWHISRHLTQSLILKPWKKHYTQASRRSIILIKRCSILQIPISQRSWSMENLEISVARRGCPWENRYAERLIRTLKEEKFISTPMRTSTKRETALGILSDRCIIRNSRTQR